MKIPPKMPEDIAELLIWWSNLPKLKAPELRQIQEFYRSIGKKHNSKKPYYRGLRISKDGFNKMIRTRKLHLKSRVAESWACRLSAAEKFAHSFDQGGANGILVKAIPNNKVWFNMEQIRRSYVKFANEEDDRVIGPTGVELLERVNMLKECELVTETICTKCDMEEMERITFQFDGSEKIIDFLKSIVTDKRYAILIPEYSPDYVYPKKVEGPYGLTKQIEKWQIVTIYPPEKSKSWGLSFGR